MLPKIIITILAATDLITTYIAINNGGTELNPLVSAIGFYWASVLKILFLSFVILIAERYLERYEKQNIRYMYCGISIMWLAATLNNLLVIFH